MVNALADTSVGGLTIGQVWGMGLITAMAVYFVSRRPVKVPVAPATLLLVYLSLTLVSPELRVALDTSLKLGSLAAACRRSRARRRDRRGQEAIVQTMWAAAFCSIVAMALMMAQGRYGAAYYGLTQTTESVTTPHEIASYVVLLLPFILAPMLADRWAQAWSSSRASSLSGCSPRSSAQLTWPCSRCCAPI